MASESTFHDFEGDDWRGNMPPDTTPQPKLQPPETDKPDELMPRLDENDVWLYQNQIEAMIRRALPDTMNTRFIQMLKVLGARARTAHKLEKESGHYIGLDL